MLVFVNFNVLFFTFKIFLFLALTLRINLSCVRYSTINCLNLMNKKWMDVVMIAQANDVTHSEIKLMFHPDEFCNLVFQNK